MTIFDITEQYLHERQLADQTQVHYRFIARRFVADTNEMNMRSVTTQVLIQWREKVLARNVSANTWNNYLRHFRILLQYAADIGVFKEPPDTQFLSLPCLNDRPKTVDLHNLHRIVAYLQSEESPFQPTWFWVTLLRVLFYTGMRRRQVAGLRWQDLNFDERTIHLDSRTSKSRRAWKIPMPTPVIPSLQYLRSKTLEHVENDEFFSERYVFNISLFNSSYRSNNRINEMGVTNFFRKLSNLTGIRISAHRLRHTMATELSAEGNYRELQQLLGHRSVYTTMKYIHPKLTQVRNLVNRLTDTQI